MSTTPDDLHGHGSVSFIYTENGNLWVAHYDDPHFRQYNYGYIENRGVTHTMMLADPNISQDIFGHPLNTRELGKKIWEMRAQVDSKAIIGRISADRTTISLWNNSSQYPSLISRLLAPSLQALVDQGYASQETEVWLPSNHNAWKYPYGTIGEIISTKNAEPTRTQPQADQPDNGEDKIALARRMHLARGAEKQAIMKKLGVGYSSNKEHPWTSSLKKAGLLKPGQKFWAPHSESRFERRLNTILEQY